MQLDDFLDYGKSQSGVTLLLLATRHPKEFFENVGKIFLRDALAGILNGKADPGPFRARGNPYGTAGRRMFERIVEKVGENMLDAQRIRKHGRDIRRAGRA